MTTEPTPAAPPHLFRDLVRQFSSNHAHPAIQFFKYAVAGGVATVTHILVFHLLAWKLFPALEERDWFVQVFNLALPPLTDAVRSRNSMIDNFLTFLLSNLVAYLINIVWVFKAGRHSRVVEILLFYLVSGFSMLLGTLLMGWLISRFGMLTTYAFGANIFTSLAINYAMRKFFIFKG